MMSNNELNKDKKILNRIRHKKLWNSNDISLYCTVARKCLTYKTHKIGQFIKEYQRKLNHDKHINITASDKAKYDTLRLHRYKRLIQDSNKLSHLADKESNNSTVLTAYYIIMILTSSQAVASYRGQNHLIIYGISILDGSVPRYVMRFEDELLRQQKRVAQLPNLNDLDLNTYIKLDRSLNKIRKEVSNISKQDYLRHKGE